MTGIVVAMLIGAIATSYIALSKLQLAVLLLVACLASVRWNTLFVLLWALGFSLGALSLSLTAERFDQERLIEPIDSTVEIQVDGLPKTSVAGVVSFRAKVKNAPLSAQHVYLSWLEAPETLRPGQIWRLQLRAKPIVGQLNPVGFDAERWAFLNRLHARGWVVGGEPLADRFNLHRMRYSLSERLRLRLGESGRFLVALAVGDRRFLTTQDWQMLQRTGTSHLLAISGLHIGLVAGFGLCFGRCLRAVSVRLSRGRLDLPRWELFAALLLAIGYALLAGLSLPTRRALLMLAVALTSITLLRFAQPSRGLALAALAVLLMDPTAPLQVGFWLSFGAVAALLWGATQSQSRSWRDGLRAWLKVQWVVGLALVPLLSIASLPTAWLAPLVNVVAIPWVAISILPPLLLSIALDWLAPALADAALSLSELSTDVLVVGLQWVAALQWPLTIGELHWRALVPFGVGLGLLWFAQSVPRRLGACLCLGALIPTEPQWPDDVLAKIHVMDVGQGQAALIETRHKLLVYDAGPASRFGWNAGESILRPFIQSLGKSPDLVVISHHDQDHAGGAQVLQQQWSEADWLAPNESRSEGRCQIGQDELSDELSFSILHPNRYLPYLGNDSSCVLSVQIGSQRLLLAGDISTIIEQRLLRNGLAEHDWLLVPHHGSKTSSSDEFVRRVSPAWAVASVGKDNAFGLPHQSVVARYRQQQSHWLTTADSGYLQFSVRAEAIRLELAQRADRRRIWHFDN